MRGGDGAGVNHTSPDLREAAVEVADAAGEVGDQDAVGRRLERGAQFGGGGFVAFGGALLGFGAGSGAGACGLVANRGFVSSAFAGSGL